MPLHSGDNTAARMRVDHDGWPLQRNDSVSKMPFAEECESVIAHLKRAHV